MGKTVDFSVIPAELLTQLAGDLPLELKPGSILDWRCEVCKGVWSASYYKRAVQGTGCPYCSGQKVLAGFNDLESRYPEIAVEYSKANPLLASQISFGSGKRVIWDCKSCNQSYEASVGNKTNLNRGCPYCTGKKPIVGVNDFATLRPNEAKEWAKENEDSPSDYTVFSNKIKIWRCKDNHTWKAQIATRAMSKGCKRCSRKESQAEKDVAVYIQSLTNELILSNDRSALGGLELDIFIPSLSLAVEYNGLYWHSDAFLARRGLNADTLHTDKIRRCESIGIKLLYVWEDDWYSRRSLIEKSLCRAVLDSSDIDPVLQIVSKG